MKQIKVSKLNIFTVLEIIYKILFFSILLINTSIFSSPKKGECVGDCENGKGKFNYDFSYYVSNDTVRYSEIGEYYSAAKKEAIFLNSFDSNGEIIKTEKFHIDILTTTDVIFQYNDLNVMHTFVLSKEK